MGTMQFILATTILSWAGIRVLKWVALKWNVLRNIAESRKAIICWVALLASVTFSGVMVEFLPHALCWSITVVVLYFVLKCDEFKASLKKIC